MHGNIEALEAMLARFEELGVDKYVCLGDIVGYGADPDQCCSRIRDLADIVLPDHDDNDVRLGDLWDERPATLVWLRHYG